MKLIFFFSLLLIIDSSKLSAQSISYKCTHLGKTKIEWKTTQGSKPIKYQGNTVVIVKNELKQNGKIVFNFYTYRFNNRLYILDGSNSKLNYTKDDVLFELPQPQELKFSVKNVMEKATLMLNRFITVNGNSFYTYDVYSKQQDINIAKLIFDQNYNITEVELTDNINGCSCTRPNIKIQLR